MGLLELYSWEALKLGGLKAWRLGSCEARKLGGAAAGRLGA